MIEKHIKKIFILLFLVYLNQGFSGIPAQSLSYLMKETWGWSVAKMSFIGAICTIPWFGKIFYGMLSDLVPIFGLRRKPYLVVCYSMIIMLGLYVYFFGFSLVSLLIVSLLSGLSYAMADVVIDGIAVTDGQKYGITGICQSVQWSAIDIAAILLGIGGGLIAQYFSYQTAYLLTIILPSITFLFLIKYYKENKVERTINRNYIAELKIGIRDRQLWIAMLFLVLYYLTPGFGTAIFFKSRDVLGFSKLFIGWLGTISAVCSLIGTIIYFKIHQKFDMKKLLFWTTVISGILTMAYVYYNSKIAAIFFAVVFSPFSAFTHLTILDFCARIVPKGYEATFFALIMGLLNLSASGSSALGGFLYQYTGLNLLIFISAVTTFFCLPLLKYIHLNRTNLKEEVN